jgi:hypothetical protein
MVTTKLSRRVAIASGAAAALMTSSAHAALSLPNDDREEWLALYRTFCRAERDLNEATENAELMAWELPEYEAYQAAEDAIVDKPANSFTGIAVKLALWVHIDGEPPGLEQTLDDAEHQMAIAAWRDAIRLAGLPEGLGTRGYRVAAKLDMKPTGGRNG